MVVKDFVVNRHGRLVFPSNAWPRLDFSVFDTVGQLSAAVSRDFEAKAPSASQIVSRLEAGTYPSRYEFLRDLGLHAFWVNRFAITMYDKRPTRWRDVPRDRDDVFLPLLTPWPGFERSSGIILAAYQALSPSWDEEVEQKIFEIMFAVFAHLRHDAAELPAIKPTVAEFLADPRNHTFVLSAHEPDWPVYSRDEVIDAEADVPQLEALLRWAMVLHNQYPWAGSTTRLAAGEEIGDDDFVVLFSPRDDEVADFIRRVRAGGEVGPPQRAAPPLMAHPVADYPPVEVRKRFSVMPRLESLAGVTGEYVCTNEDIIRNSSWNWSPMTASEITAKTGIGQRTYTHRALEELAADAACAGLPYGLLEAIRILQEIERPVLVVCAEKFSDKLGNVRTSRMLFGDGAAALVIGPTRHSTDPDVEVIQTFASGPASEVSAVIWPNPQFDNNLTVYGPAVKAFVKRYLAQMIGELRQLPAPPGLPGSLLEAIDVVVPHQANRIMVEQAAAEAGLSPDRLYFNVGRLGNVSAASIPLAIRDAVADGVISSPVRVFTPAFGAGATAGYAVMRVDPAVVSLTQPPATGSSRAGNPAQAGGTTEDIRTGFGE